jgi:hypothetical protein
LHLLIELKKTKRIALSKEQRQRIFDKTDGLCHVCGIKLEIDSFQADHVKPFSGYIFYKNMNYFADF